MTFLVLSLAWAAPATTPPPEKVEQVADGLTFWRKGDTAEGGEEPAPMVNSEAAQDAWANRLLRQEDRRADLATADALMVDYAPVVAACATQAGVQPGAEAKATVTFASSSSVTTVVVGKGSDPGLAGCLQSTLHQAQVGGVFHPTGGVQEHGGANPTVSLGWTFVYTGPPKVTPASRVDIERSIGGIRFGTDPGAAAGASQLQTLRDITVWYRHFDDNVRLMGVPISLQFFGHAELGLVAARMRVRTDADAFRVKEALKARLGPAKYDSIYKAWYWRGDTTVLIQQHVPDAEGEEFIVMSIAEARKSGLALEIPGERKAGDVNSTTRLPRVLQDH